jgi:hypothetical protein
MEQIMNSSERPGLPDMELVLFMDAQKAALPRFCFIIVCFLIPPA